MVAKKLFCMALAICFCYCQSEEKTTRLQRNSLVEYDLAVCGDGSSAAYYTQVITDDGDQLGIEFVLQAQKVDNVLLRRKRRSETLVAS